MPNKIFEHDNLTKCKSPNNEKRKANDDIFFLSFKVHKKFSLVTKR